jgi:hypothetical protein
MTEQDVDANPSGRLVDLPNSPVISAFPSGYRMGIVPTVCCLEHLGNLYSRALIEHKRLKRNHKKTAAQIGLRFNFTVLKPLLSVDVARMKRNPGIIPGFHYVHPGYHMSGT